MLLSRICFIHFLEDGFLVIPKKIYLARKILISCVLFMSIFNEYTLGIFLLYKTGIQQIFYSFFMNLEHYPNMIERTRFLK